MRFHVSPGTSVERFVSVIYFRDRVALFCTGDFAGDLVVFLAAALVAFFAGEAVFLAAALVAFFAGEAVFLAAALVVFFAGEAVFLAAAPRLAAGDFFAGVALALENRMVING